MSSETVDTRKQQEEPLTSDWRALAARILEAGLGLVLLAAGFIKASEIAEAVKNAASYKIITAPGLVTGLVWLLIAVECALGAALLVSYKRRIYVPATFALFGLFLAALAWAKFSGATADCGCFGSWAKHTPLQALLIDLGLIGSFIVAQLLSRRERVCHEGRRLAVVALAVSAGLGIAGFSSASPTQSADPVVRLQASQPELIRSVKFNNLPVDLTKGQYILAVIDTGCDHCQANVPNFNELFDKQSNLVPFVAVCPNNDTDIAWFKKQFSPKFPIGNISNEDFLKLLKGGDTPRSFLLKDAQVVKVWDVKAPTEAEIKTAMK